ncbi:3',5'-cyclic AMP phosphodiesterase CpdA [Rhodoligotrophos appendicifer]|uniref:metallophosphoesterase family protein n=1 Tax=Rhodoligotrophos appendicifer TaxID=987056 RepID=UPI001186BC29|nr:metallophosphoesterase [Rhodoligotrophos appendicifer]
MFTLAQISDPHLAPIKSLRLKDLATKRFYGYQSWVRRRRFIHRRDVVDLMVEDIKRFKVDHIAVTGDLVNISMRTEFKAAAEWLRSVGSAEVVSVIPGNHDAYVPVKWEKSLGLWQDYMTGDMSPGKAMLDSEVFPYIRTRRNVAIIGLSTAVPTPPLIASGQLGAKQLHRMAEILPILKEKGFFRVVLIHHPPLPGMNSQRKALADAAPFRDLLEQHGAELVLHGHNHEHSLRRIPARAGFVHVIGIPSASALARNGKPAAAWYKYTIGRANGAWRCSVTIRGYNEKKKQFQDEDSFDLDLHGDEVKPGRILMPIAT